MRTTCSFLTLLLFFICHLSIAQQKYSTSKDSLSVKLHNDSVRIYRTAKILPFLALDQRNSYINKTAVSINGVQIGLILNEKHVFGLGGYTITGNTKHTRVVDDKKVPMNQTLNLKYLTAFYYFPIFDRKYWEFGLPVEIGAGSYTLSLVEEKTGKEIKGFPKKAGMALFGIGPSLTISPLPWLGFNIMGGYRGVSDKTLNLNGFYYSYGVAVNLRRIVQDLKYLKKRCIYKKEIKKL